MIDLMSNIYLNPTDYRLAPDVSIDPRASEAEKKWAPHWWVYSVPLNIRLAGFPTEEKAKAFIEKRCNPIEVRSQIYSDICRCGRSGPAWDYIRTNGIVFERCVNCRMPMRYDVMLALNKPLTENFDLDDFLNM